MYFEVYALLNTSAAATEVHTGKNILPTSSFCRQFFDAQFEENVPTKRGVTGVVADEDPT